MNVMIFSALAEPHRLAIIELLSEGPLQVGNIAERLELSQPQASKHLRVLTSVGLVQVQPVANKRIYKLRPQPLQELETWLETFRRSWDEKFDNPETYLHQLQTAENNKDHSK
ncbi:ArsR/SmtB family transcription factor [Paenibacillus monticola]|uniref:Metalloregulator ArsR/SmtB family transcription factor n=1 Tax=Paenibacillus monticola TaxID=2666075 RepID=A0A7X2H2M0_9BACL|nr:metalloregulator ArsR/SmtB family transcription factor [Paenibacillus monticola]MRN52442.1 metalloregulator ArsR/SmtB family transcription factor [Paenibacillus monticola]